MLPWKCCWNSKESTELQLPCYHGVTALPKDDNTSGSQTGESSIFPPISTDFSHKCRPGTLFPALSHGLLCETGNKHSNQNAISSVSPSFQLGFWRPALPTDGSHRSEVASAGSRCFKELNAHRQLHLLKCSSTMPHENYSHSKKPLP